MEKGRETEVEALCTAEGCSDVPAWYDKPNLEGYFLWAEGKRDDKLLVHEEPEGNLGWRKGG